MHNACIPTTIFALANDGKAFVGGISSILVISISTCSTGFGKFEQIVGDLDPARYRTGHIPRRRRVRYRRDGHMAIQCITRSSFLGLATLLCPGGLLLLILIVVYDEITFVDGDILRLTGIGRRTKHRAQVLSF